MTPTPSANSALPFRDGGFDTLPEALDYAARGETGVNVYTAKGVLSETATWGELAEGARDLARRLLHAGFKPGDRVALLAETDLAFIKSFFACQYAGLIPAPVPLPMPFAGKETYLDHVRGMIESCGAEAAFGPEDLIDWLNQATEGLTLKKVGIMADLPPAPSDIPLPTVSKGDLAYLQFSSGSTRFPLGIAVTQSALMANTDAMTRAGLGVVQGDRCVSWLPYYHDMGLVGFLLCPLVSQLTIDLLPTRAFARAPIMWLELISRNKGTLSYSPTFGYELCARRAETLALENLDLSSWRAAGLGGDMIRPKVTTAFSERFARHGFDPGAFVPSYGMAEATLALSFAPRGEGVRTDRIDTDVLERDHVARAPINGAGRQRDFVLCGPAIPGHELEVRGEDGKPLGERLVGKVYARGPSLMQTYFGRPEETARVLSPEGWLDTGDLGYFCDGQVVITGRAKDLMIVNGRNVWPQDLEWTAEGGVHGLRSGDVAAFSVDREVGEEIVVVVQRKAQDPVAREALREEVGKLIRARHGLEVTVVAAPPHSLPQTSSGKLSRVKAKALYLAGAFEIPAPAPNPAA
jgi:fatty-acyl-CoA synthase